MKQEKNAESFKNCVPHPAEQKPTEIIDLANVDAKEPPETFEKKVSNSAWRNACSRKLKEYS